MSAQQKTQQTRRDRRGIVMRTVSSLSICSVLALSASAPVSAQVSVPISSNEEGLPPSDEEALKLLKMALGQIPEIGGILSGLLGFIPINDGVQSELTALDRKIADLDAKIEQQMMALQSASALKPMDDARSHLAKAFGKDDLKQVDAATLKKYFPVPTKKSDPKPPANCTKNNENNETWADTFKAASNTLDGANWHQFVASAPPEVRLLKMIEWANLHLSLRKATDMCADNKDDTYFTKLLLRYSGYLRFAMYRRAFTHMEMVQLPEFSKQSGSDGPYLAVALAGQTPRYDIYYVSPPDSWPRTFLYDNYPKNNYGVYQDSAGSTGMINHPIHPTFRGAYEASVLVDNLKANLKQYDEMKGTTGRPWDFNGAFIWYAVTFSVNEHVRMPDGSIRTLTVKDSDSGRDLDIEGNQKKLEEMISDLKTIASREVWDWFAQKHVFASLNAWEDKLTDLYHGRDFSRAAISEFKTQMDLADSAGTYYYNKGVTGWYNYLGLDNGTTPLADQTPWKRLVKVVVPTYVNGAPEIVGPYKFQMRTCEGAHPSKPCKEGSKDTVDSFNRPNAPYTRFRYTLDNAQDYPTLNIAHDEYGDDPYLGIRYYPGIIVPTPSPENFMYLSTDDVRFYVADPWYDGTTNSRSAPIATLQLEGVAVKD